MLWDINYRKLLYYFRYIVMIIEKTGLPVFEVYDHKVNNVYVFQQFN